MKGPIEAIKLDISDKIRWDELLKSAYNSSYRLSLDYALTKSSKLQNHEIHIFSRNNEDIVGTIYTIKSDSLNIFKVAEIRFGILLKSKNDLQFLPQIIEHFSAWATKRKVCYINIASYFPMSFNGKITKTHVKLDKILSEFDFKPINKGLHTYLIDLTQSENELLYKMNRSTRKLIRRGLKTEIRVEIRETLDQKLLEEFWDLYSNLGESKQFGYLNKDVFFKRVKGLFENKHALLFVTYCSDTIVSITMTSRLGIPAGMYGAINQNFKNIEKCISPGPISVWAIMNKLKEEGFKVYDMGFCPARIPDKRHPNYSVWLFKYNFGPDHVQFAPTYGKILKPIRGKLFKFMKYRK